MLEILRGLRIVKIVLKTIILKERWLKMRWRRPDKYGRVLRTRIGQ